MPRSARYLGTTSWAWQQRRAWWARWLGEGNTIGCSRCGLPIADGMAWHLDHVADDGDDSNTRPAHARCNTVAGGRLGGHRRAQLAVVKPQVDGPFLVSGGSTPSTILAAHTRDEPDREEATAMTPDDAASCPWLEDLADVPDGATWPRLMTGRHPRAVGSYGPVFVDWVAQEGRWPLWWWQELVATRALEHDVDGRLVWRHAAVSTSRQCGKSYLTAMLAMWRITQAPAIFGEPQNVLHIAKDLNVARTVQQPMRAYGRQRPDEYRVLESGARIEIEHISGSTWMLRSSAGGYGHSCSLAIVDEAWAIRADVVDDAVIPTQAQRRSAQCFLISTANAKATSLMIGRRAGALADLDAPDGVLWCEWSAEPDADLDDVEAWQAASPQWDEARRREIAGAYSSALQSRPTDPTEPDPLVSFETQWLNRWPGSVEPRRQRGELLVDIEEWRACEEDHNPPGPLTVAVEDYFGEGACFALAGELDDGRVYVESRTFASRREALDAAGWLLDKFVCSRLVVGASLAGDPQAVELRRDLSGSRETAAGLPLLRALLAEGRLVHYQAEALTEQLTEARVTRTATGQLSLVAGTRSDAIRATAWALHSLEQNPPMVPRIR